MFKALNPDNASRYVLISIIIAFFIKLALAHYIPVTGDEAYYAIWGVFPAWGGYDHTPFIGWLLYPFLKISSQPIILRLPMILTTSIIGWCIYTLLQEKDRCKAALASIAFLISPLSLCAVLITTDTPVILFVFLSGISVITALKKNDHLGWFALGGLFLGLAFFSKYFAVLLALAYFIYFIFINPSRKRLLGLGILFLMTLPFGLENIYWNYTHAWANILFNIYNRNTEEYFRISTVFTYFITLFYIITPPLFYYLIKHHFKNFKTKDLLPYLIAIPLLFFLLLSTWKSIGLHWPLSFITFIYLWMGEALTLKESIKTVKFLIYFTGVHLLLIMTILLLPMKTLHELPLIQKNPKLYTKLVFFFKHKDIIQSLKKYYNFSYTLTSLDYVQADMAFYDTNHYAPTFGLGDTHGREDDLITDFKEYNHKNFLIFYSRPPRRNEYAPYFKTNTVKTFSQDGAVFYYVLGQNFNYPAYRNSVLTKINQLYWHIPPYLPHTPSFFTQRYALDMTTPLSDGSAR